MTVGLHDADGQTKFPNLALMKISAWHKAYGDTVSWWMPICEYDRVYSSKVFTFTPEEPMLPENTVRGGTGYGLYNELPPEIDRMYPDYSIYPNVDYAIGFLTRGCIRKCPWCVVPKKEGIIRPYNTWREIKRPDSKKIVFMDNNVLACEYGIEQMRSMIGQDVRIDFNQGLDARLITDEIAGIIARLKWIRSIRTACDTAETLDAVKVAEKRLEAHGVNPQKIFVYALVRDIDEAEKRVIALRDMNVDVFAQPYRDFENKIEPTKDQKHFARWVNRKEIFKTVKRFRDYEESEKKRVAKLVGVNKWPYS